MTVYCGGQCEDGHPCCHGGMHYLAVTYLGMKSEDFREHDVVCDVAQVVQERDRFRRVLKHIAQHCVQEPDIAQLAFRALDGSADVDEEEPCVTGCQVLVKRDQARGAEKCRYCGIHRAEMLRMAMEPTECLTCGAADGFSEEKSP